MSAVPPAPTPQDPLVGLTGGVVGGGPGGNVGNGPTIHAGVGPTDVAGTPWVTEDGRG